MAGDRKSMPQQSHEHDMQKQEPGMPGPMSGNGRAMPTHESLPGGREGGSKKGPKASPQL
jgi:hypothetical protein